MTWRTRLKALFEPVQPRSDQAFDCGGEMTPPDPPSGRLLRITLIVLLVAVLGTVALSQIESCTQQGQPPQFDMRRPR